jgi:hypothetical protein
MDTSSSKTKFSFFFALDLSKGILFAIFAIAAIKVFLTPGEDPISVILWRLLEVTVVVVPVVILGCFIYALINYDYILACEIEAQEKRKTK